MVLGDGYHDVPAGKVAAVVTYLEMREKVPARPVPEPEGVELVRVAAPEPAWYRALFHRVGAEDWLWFSRLVMEDDALAEIIGAAGVEVYALQKAGEDLGLLELDFREPGACELAFFGLAPELIGGGVGRWLMNRAIDLAWAKTIDRFHLHTCTLDHPAALSFYRRSGFVAYRRQVEIADDPRLTGHLPRDAGPHVPVIG